MTKEVILIAFVAIVAGIIIIRAVRNHFDMIAFREYRQAAREQEQEILASLEKSQAEIDEEQKSVQEKIKLEEKVQTLLNEKFANEKKLSQLENELSEKLQYIEELESEKKPTVKISTFQDNKDAGTVFELEIKALLEEKFANDIAKGEVNIIHNFNPQLGTHTNQMDIILINDAGIYIIECKRWSGSVFGAAHWDNCLKLNLFFNENGSPILKRLGLIPKEPFPMNPFKQLIAQQIGMYNFLKDRLGKKCIHIKRLLVFPNYTDISLLDLTTDDDSDAYFWYGKKDNLITAITTLQQEAKSKGIVPNYYDMQKFRTAITNWQNQ